MKVRKNTLELRNKTYTYILPSLGTNVKYFKNLSACFIGDVEHPKKKNKIFLLYRMNKTWSDELHEWLTDMYLYDHHYKVLEDYVMYVYNLPEGYEKNYFLFRDGKYSEFNNEYKKQILKFHGTEASRKSLDVVKKVLYRSEELYQQMEEALSTPELNSYVKIPRDQEISSIPDKKKEYFALKMITEQNNSKTLTEWD